MRKFIAIPLCMLFLYLLFFPVQIISSVADGLTLWYTSVIPSLFPFMFMCRLIVSLNLFQYIPTLILWPLQRIFGCSRAGSLAVITGFLCGVPVGASVVCELYHTGKISEKESRLLLCFVNNLSPGFLISYLCVSQLCRPDLILPTVCMVYGSACIYGVFLSFNLRKNPNNQPEVLSQIHFKKYPENQTKKIESFFLIFDDAVYVSIINTLKLGGYIIFFSILSDLLFLFPVQHPFFIAFSSSIEATKGLAVISQSDLTDYCKYLLSVALASFGGWSAAFQTAGICRMNLRQFSGYIKSRAIITLLSVLLYTIRFFCFL